MEAEEKTKRIQRLTEQMEAGIQQVFQSDSYKDYLSTMARMPQYSFGNTVLIYLNNPGAAIVTTYEKMREDFGYQVKWGEKSFYLMRPNKYRKSVESAVKEIDRNIMKGKQAQIGQYYFWREETGNYRIKNTWGQDEKNLTKKELREFIKERIIDKEFAYPPFVAYPVFDISQAAPIVIGQDENGNDILDPKAARIRLSPVDEIPDFEEEDVIRRYFEAAARTADMPITYHDPIGKENGYINEDGINITPTITKTHALKTLIHEIAHGRLHLHTQNQAEKGQKEVEAESIAFITCQYFGIDTSNYSFGYVASWSSGQDLCTLKASLDTIQKESNRMIRDIEFHLDQIKDKDLDKEAIYLKNPIFQDMQSTNLTFYVAEYAECHMAGRYQEGVVSRQSAATLFKEYHKAEDSDPAVGVVYQDSKIQLFPPQKDDMVCLKEIIEAQEFFLNHLSDMIRNDGCEDQIKDFSAKDVQVNIYRLKMDSKDNLQSKLYRKSYDSLRSAMIRVRKTEYNLAASIPMKEVRNISGLPDLLYRIQSKLPAAGDVVEIVNERKCSFFYYIGEESIQEFTNFNQDLSPDKAITEFAGLYRINPVLAITDASSGRLFPLAKLARSAKSIDKDKAVIISKLDRRVLPLPFNEESLISYLEKGAVYADGLYQKICKTQNESMALQVIWSEVPEFTAGKIYTLKESAACYKSAVKAAMTKHEVKVKVRRIEMTIFLKDRKAFNQKALNLITCNIQVSDSFPTFLKAVRDVLPNKAMTQDKYKERRQKELRVMRAMEEQTNRNKENMAKSR